MGDNMDNNKITEYDIIQEVGSICACNSTLAFSEMIGRTIKLEAPNLELIKSKEISNLLGNKDTIVVGVHTQILTGIKGQLSLLFDEKSAYSFISVFDSQDIKNCGFITELGISSIKEIGNVVVSAYSGAMSLLLDISIIPSIPVLTNGTFVDVINFGFNTMINMLEENIYVHTMTFNDEEKKLKAHFFF